MNAVQDCVYLMSAYPGSLFFVPLLRPTDCIMAYLPSRPVLCSSILCVNVLLDQTKGLTPCVGAVEPPLILITSLMSRGPLCPCGTLRSGKWPTYRLCVSDTMQLAAQHTLPSVNV